MTGFIFLIAVAFFSFIKAIGDGTSSAFEDVFLKDKK